MLAETFMRQSCLNPGNKKTTSQTAFGSQLPYKGSLVKKALP